MLWRCACSAPWPAKMETDRSSRRVCCRQGWAMENHGAAPNGDKPCFQMRTSRRECTITPKAYPLRQVLGSKRMVEETWSELCCRRKDSNIARGRFNSQFSRPFPFALQSSSTVVSTSPQKKKKRKHQKATTKLKPTASGSSVQVPPVPGNRNHW